MAKLETGDPRLDEITGGLDTDNRDYFKIYGGGDETDRDDAPPPGEADRAPRSTGPGPAMKNRFLIDPTQTDEEIVEFIMSMLREKGAFEKSPLNDHPPSGSSAIPDVKLGG